MAGGTIVKLRELRTGKRQYKVVNLGDLNDKVEVAVVLLSADTMLDINEKVESRYGVEDNQDSNKPSITKNQYYNILLCYNCTRDVDNIDTLVFDDEDEVGTVLDLEDIKRICDAYNQLLVNRAPKLETLNDGDLEEIKKALEVTSLSDLSLVSQVHLAYFLQTIHSEKCQTNNGSGYSSTN